jgi:hypothetical protein
MGSFPQGLASGAARLSERPGALLEFAETGQVYDDSVTGKSRRWLSPFVTDLVFVAKAHTEREEHPCPTIT